MEIDAFTKKGKGHTGKGESKTDVQKTTCFVCGRVGHMTKDCSVPNNRGQKGKRQKNSVNEVQRSRRRLHRWPPQPVKSRESPRPALRIVRSEDDGENHETGYILAPMRHIEPFRKSKRMVHYARVGGQLCMCALHEILSGSSSNHAGIPRWYQRVGTN